MKTSVLLGKSFIICAFRLGRFFLHTGEVRGSNPVSHILSGSTFKLSEKPVISPDGKRVAGYYWDASALRYVLNVVPSEGGEPERTFTLHGEKYFRSAIRWTPYGKALTYSASQGGVSNIWLLPLAGGPAKQLTNFTSDDMRGFDWTPDNRLILARGIRILS